MTVTVTVPAELTTQQETLTAQIANIDSDLATLNEQRTAAVDGLARVERVIRILKGEPEPVQEVPVGGRKPMSEQAKQNIREGLLRAAAAKKAVQAAIPATAPTPEPAAPAPTPVTLTEAPKATVAPKGSKK
jgi:hypothetical protein